MARCVESRSNQYGGQSDMGREIQLLECTLRDGCLGLEDAWINGISDVATTYQERNELTDIIASSRSEIIELGSIQITGDDRTRFSIYQNIEEISTMIPKKRNHNQQYVALFRGPDTPIKDIPNHSKDMVDGLRVIIRYSELKKSLEFCRILSQKGFNVFIQPMVTMRYSEDELNMIIDYANEMNAYALYLVDSYGYMMPGDVLKFVKKFDARLNSDIRIGFHAHNNMNMAFANAITFLNYKTERSIIIDATATGMGQGAGNLQTEIITDYLNKNHGKSYNYEAILDACDFVERYNENGLWGYSVMRLIPAVHGVAYKYATYLRKKFGLTYKQIQSILDILDTMPDDVRYRYTNANLKKILAVGNFGIGDQL